MMIAPRKVSAKRTDMPRRFRGSVAALLQSREHIPKGSAQVTFLPLSLPGKGGLFIPAQMEASERLFEGKRPPNFGCNWPTPARAEFVQRAPHVMYPSNLAL